MNFLRLISERESIRNYDPENLVQLNELMAILDAGCIAPSAANLQPWRFLMVMSPEILVEIRKTYPRTWFADAAQVLIVTGNKEKAWKRPDGYNSIETDLAIAMDHMILAAESMGVATCWIANFDYEKLRSVLNLEKDEVVFAMTPIGYPKEGFVKKGVKFRKQFDEVVRFM